MSLHEESQAEELLLPSEFIESISQESRQEEKRKEAIQFYVDQLTLLFYPLILTFSLVCWIEITLNIDNSLISNPLMFYDELASDSTGVRLGGSVLNAIIVVCGITAMTFLFVLCFKYRLYKVAGHCNIIFFFVCLLNSPIFVLVYILLVGTISSVNSRCDDDYIMASALATTRLSNYCQYSHTVSIYDLFAVLCPSGPLRLLISMAEERQENIPALIYSAGMASIDENDSIGGYMTQESNSSKRIDWSSWLPFSSKSKGYTTLENEEEEAGGSSLSTNELQNLSDPVPHRHSEEEEDDDDDMNAIKLGLGDFIFYSVLVGKASRTDPITLCLCIIAILTGLSLTIFILTLNRTALPALPISILFGAVTYAIGYFMT
ncbi:hypothetical protein INT48_003950, partial [Thamnidium elegans]